MEVTVGGSLLVDLATKDDLAEHHKRLERLLPEHPRGKYFQIVAVGTTTAGFSGSGPIAIAFTPASPPGGRHWFLEWLSIFVGTAAAAAATANLNAAVAIGRSPVGPNASIPAAFLGALSEADIVVPGLVVPSNTNIPDKTIVKSQSQLYVVLAGSGLAASTTYIATAGVIETVDSEESYFW